MKTLSDYSLAPLPDSDGIPDYRSRLLRFGKPLGAIVCGDTVEFQYAGENWALLATGYEYYEGVAHWLYLFDEGGHILDQIVLPDEYGFVCDATPQGTGTLSFGLQGSNEIWRLSVHHLGYWSFSLAEMHMRPARLYLAKRHLQLQRQRIGK